MKRGERENGVREMGSGGKDAGERGKGGERDGKRRGDREGRRERDEKGREVGNKE